MFAITIREMKKYNPDLGATLMRTLTLKSQIKFGKFSDMKVQDLLTQGMVGKNYLLWLYYNTIKINYNQEVKDKLGLTKDFEITKPGRYPGEFYRFKDAHYSDETRLLLWGMKKNNEVINRRANNSVVHHEQRKSNLRNKNHGR